MPISGPLAATPTSVRGNRAPLPDTSALGPGLSGSYNGVVFGIPPSGTAPVPWVEVATFLGFDDLPVIAAADAARDGDEGDFPGQDWAEERFMQLGLRVVAPDHATYRTQMEAIKAAFTKSLTAELPLYIWDSTRVVFCRCRKRSIPVDVSWDQFYGEALMEMVASDPRIYDALFLQVTIGVALTSSGFTLPLTMPMTFGTSVGGSGTFQAANLGNFPTRPTARISGPVDNPRIEAVDQSKKLQLALSLVAGDYIDIDFAARSIILNGTASRRSALTGDSTWFELLPGVNNLRFAANTVAIGSLLTFGWRSAWL